MFQENNAREIMKKYLQAFREGKNTLGLKDYIEQRHSTLSEDIFVEANLTSMNLSGMDLSGINFSQADFNGTLLEITNFKNAIITNAKNLNINSLSLAIIDNVIVEDENNKKIIGAALKIQRLFRKKKAVEAMIDYSKKNPPVKPNTLAKELAVENPKSGIDNSSKQLGWHCFDVAVSIERKALVEYALKNTSNKQFRQWLVPEIRHAAMLTAAYLNSQQNNEAKNDTITKLTPYIFPEKMRTTEMQKLVHDYKVAREREEVCKAVNEANNKLKRGAEQRLSLEGLIHFLENNKNLNDPLFLYLIKIKSLYLAAAEEALQTYCLRQDTYVQYVKTYYNKEKGVALKRDSQGEISASIIDIAAHMLQKQICIFQKINEQDKCIYSTNTYEDKIEIYYNGQRHFRTKDHLVYYNSTTHHHPEENEAYINARSVIDLAEEYRKSHVNIAKPSVYYRTYFELLGFAFSLNRQVEGTEKTKNFHSIIEKIDFFCREHFNLVDVSMASINQLIEHFYVCLHAQKVDFEKELDTLEAEDTNRLDEFISNLRQEQHRCFKELFSTVFSKIKTNINYAIIGIGSISHGWETLYSDIEYIVLIKDKRDRDVLAIFTYLMEYCLTAIERTPLRCAKSFLQNRLGDTFENYRKQHIPVTASNPFLAPTEHHLQLVVTLEELKNSVFDKVTDCNNHLLRALLTPTLLYDHQGCGLYEKWIKIIEENIYTSSGQKVLAVLLQKNIMLAKEITAKLTLQLGMRPVSSPIVDIKPLFNTLLFIMNYGGLYKANYLQQKPFPKNWREAKKLLQNSKLLDERIGEAWEKLLYVLYVLRLKKQRETQSKQAPILIGQDTSIPLKILRGSEKILKFLTELTSYLLEPTLGDITILSSNFIKNEISFFEANKKTEPQTVYNFEEFIIGSSDFKELVKGQGFIDKSLFIKTILDKPKKVNLIARPFRFGKTTLMSMLNSYFNFHEKACEELFKRLKFINEIKKIKEDKNYRNYEYYKGHQNAYPVIFITFNKITENLNFEQVLYQIWQIIVKEFKKFSEALLISQVLNDEDKQWCQQVFLNEAPKSKNSPIFLSAYDDFLKNFLDNPIYFGEDTAWYQNAKKRTFNHLIGSIPVIFHSFMGLLHKHYKKSVIFLVDEYDKPIQNGYKNGYYQEICDFMRSFFTITLKDNNALNFSVITGVCRISKAQIFSGLNNFLANTIVEDTLYSSYFGLTEGEFSDIIAKKEYQGLLKFNSPAQKTKYLSCLEDWYGGYFLNDQKGYNLHSMEHNFDSSNHVINWPNTNSLIKDILLTLKKKYPDIYGECRNSLQILRQGKKIQQRLVLETELFPEKQSKQTFLSLLALCGYLTVTDYTPHNQLANLSVPNLEIFQYFNDLMTSSDFNEPPLENNLLDFLIAKEFGSVQEKRYFLDYDKLLTSSNVALRLSILERLKEKNWFPPDAVEGIYYCLLDDEEQIKNLSVEVLEHHSKKNNSLVVKEKLISLLSDNYLNQSSQVFEDVYIRSLLIKWLLPFAQKNDLLLLDIILTILNSSSSDVDLQELLKAFDIHSNVQVFGKIWDYLEKGMVKNEFFSRFISEQYGLLENARLTIQNREDLCPYLSNSRSHFNISMYFYRNNTNCFFDNLLFSFHCAAPIMQMRPYIQGMESFFDLHKDTANTELTQEEQILWVFLSLRLAYLYLFESKLEATAKWLAYTENLLKKEKIHAQEAWGYFYIVEGKMYQWAGNLQKARQSFQQVLEKRDNNDERWQNFCKKYDLAKDAWIFETAYLNSIVQSSIAYLDCIEGHYQKSVESFQHAIQVKTEFQKRDLRATTELAISLLYYGLALHTAGEYRKANNQYEVAGSLLKQYYGEQSAHKKGFLPIYWGVLRYYQADLACLTHQKSVADQYFNEAEIAFKNHQLPLEDIWRLGVQIKHAQMHVIYNELNNAEIILKNIQEAVSHVKEGGYYRIISEIYECIGTICIRCGKPKEGKIYYREALDGFLSDPSWTGVWSQESASFANIEDNLDYLIFQERYHSDRKNQVRYRRVLHPQFATILRQYAAAEINEGNLPQAQELLEESLYIYTTLYGSSPTKDIHKAGQCFQELGLAQAMLTVFEWGKMELIRGKYEEALACFNTVLIMQSNVDFSIKDTSTPDIDLTRSYLAMVYIQQGEFAKAGEQLRSEKNRYTNLINWDPMFFLARANLKYVQGYHLEALALIDDALNYLRNTLKESILNTYLPGVQCLNFRIQVLIGLGRYSQAENDLKMLERYAQGEFLKTLHANLKLTLYQFSGQLDDAEQAYRNRPLCAAASIEASRLQDNYMYFLVRRAWYNEMVERNKEPFYHPTQRYVNAESFLAKGLAVKRQGEGGCLDRIEWGIMYSLVKYKLYINGGDLQCLNDSQRHYQTALGILTDELKLGTAWLLLTEKVLPFWPFDNAQQNPLTPNLYQSIHLQAADHLCNQSEQKFLTFFSVRLLLQAIEMILIYAKPKDENMSQRLERYLHQLSQISFSQFPNNSDPEITILFNCMEILKEWVKTRTYPQLPFSLVERLQSKHVISQKDNTSYAEFCSYRLQWSVQLAQKIQKHQSPNFIFSTWSEKIPGENELISSKSSGLESTSSNISTQTKRNFIFCSEWEERVKECLEMRLCLLTAERGVGRRQLAEYVCKSYAAQNRYSSFHIKAGDLGTIDLMTLKVRLKELLIELRVDVHNDGMHSLLIGDDKTVLRQLLKKMENSFFIVYYIQAPDVLEYLLEIFSDTPHSLIVCLSAQEEQDKCIFPIIGLQDPLPILQKFNSDISDLSDVHCDLKLSSPSWKESVRAYIKMRIEEITVWTIGHTKASRPLKEYLILKTLNDRYCDPLIRYSLAHPMLIQILLAFLEERIRKIYRRTFREWVDKGGESSLTETDIDTLRNDISDTRNKVINSIKDKFDYVSKNNPKKYSIDMLYQSYLPLLKVFDKLEQGVLTLVVQFRSPIHKELYGRLIKQVYSYVKSQNKELKLPDTAPVNSVQKKLERYELITECNDKGFFSMKLLSMDYFKEHFSRPEELRNTCSLYNQALCLVDQLIIYQDANKRLVEFTYPILENAKSLFNVWPAVRNSSFFWNSAVSRMTYLRVFIKMLKYYLFNCRDPHSSNLLFAASRGLFEDKWDKLFSSLPSIKLTNMNPLNESDLQKDGRLLYAELSLLEAYGALLLKQDNACIDKIKIALSFFQGFLVDCDKNPELTELLFHNDCDTSSKLESSMLRFEHLIEILNNVDKLELLLPVVLNIGFSLFIVIGVLSRQKGNNAFDLYNNLLNSFNSIDTKYRDSFKNKLAMLARLEASRANIYFEMEKHYSFGTSLAFVLGEHHLPTMKLKGSGSNEHYEDFFEKAETTFRRAHQYNYRYYLIPNEDKKNLPSFSKIIFLRKNRDNTITASLIHNRKPPQEKPFNLASGFEKIFANNVNKDRVTMLWDTDIIEAAYNCFNLYPRDPRQVELYLAMAFRELKNYYVSPNTRELNNMGMYLDKACDLMGKIYPGDEASRAGAVMLQMAIELARGELAFNQGRYEAAWRAMERAYRLSLVNKEAYQCSEYGLSVSLLCIRWAYFSGKYELAYNQCRQIITQCQELVDNADNEFDKEFWLAICSEIAWLALCADKYNRFENRHYQENNIDRILKIEEKRLHPLLARVQGGRLHDKFTLLQRRWHYKLVVGIQNSETTDSVDWKQETAALEKGIKGASCFDRVTCSQYFQLCGDIAYQEGNYQTAESYYQKALEKIEPVWTTKSIITKNKKDDFSRARVYGALHRVNLAFCKTQRGDISVANQLFHEALMIIEKYYLKGGLHTHPILRTVVFAYGYFLLLQGLRIANNDLLSAAWQIFHLTKQSEKHLLMVSFILGSDIVFDKASRAAVNPTNLYRGTSAFVKHCAALTEIALGANIEKISLPSDYSALVTNLLTRGPTMPRDTSKERAVIRQTSHELKHKYQNITLGNAIEEVCSIISDCISQEEMSSNGKLRLSSNQSDIINEQNNYPPPQDTVLVIGASRGIGLGFVEYYLQQGCNVIATCRQYNADCALAKLEEKYPYSLTVYRNIDITQVKSIKRLSLQVKHIDLLILNAGVKGYPVPGTKTLQNNEGELQDAFDVNTKGHNNILLEFFDRLLHPKAAVIYNSTGVSSISDNISGHYHPYRISKAAGNQMIRYWGLSLLEAWQGSFLDLPCVFAICSGWVKTDMGGPNARLTVEESVSQMAQVIAQIRDSKKTHGLLMYNGSFLEVYKTPEKLIPLLGEEQPTYEALIQEKKRLDRQLAELQTEKEETFGSAPSPNTLKLSSRPEFMRNTVVIIGANTVIGLEFVKHYLQQGHMVIATCERHKNKALSQLQIKHSGRLTIYFDIDITNFQNIKHFTQKVDYVDLLILSADEGLNTFASSEILKRCEDELQHAFEINAKGYNNIMLEFFEKLLHPHAAAVYISSTLSATSVIPSNLSCRYRAYSIGKTAGNQMIRNWALMLIEEWIEKSRGTLAELPCAFAICPNEQQSTQANVVQIMKVIEKTRISKEFHGLLTCDGCFLDTYKIPEKLIPSLGQIPTYESLLESNERLKSQLAKLSLDRSHPQSRAISLFLANQVPANPKSSMPDLFAQDKTNPQHVLSYTFFGNTFQNPPDSISSKLLCTVDDVKQFCVDQRIHGFKSIPSDGNCFFRAVLAAVGQDEEGYANLRANVIKYMSEHFEKFTNHFPENAEPFDMYIQRMSKQKEWAEGAIIAATALHLNITIDMIQLQKQNQEIQTGGRFTAAEIANADGRILLLRVNNNHYHVGYCLENYELQQDLEQHSPRLPHFSVGRDKKP